MFQEGTIILFPVDSVQSFLRTSGGTPYVFARVGRFCTEFSSNPVSSGVVRILQGCIPDIACSPMTSAISMFEYFKGALQTAVCTVFRSFCFRPFCFRSFCFSGMWIIFDPLDICQFWAHDCNILHANMLHADMERGAPAKTPFHSYLLAFF